MYNINDEVILNGKEKNKNQESYLLLEINRTDGVEENNEKHISTIRKNRFGF